MGQCWLSSRSVEPFDDNRRRPKQLVYTVASFSVATAGMFAFSDSEESLFLEITHPQYTRYEVWVSAYCRRKSRQMSGVVSLLPIKR